MRLITAFVSSCLLVFLSIFLAGCGSSPKQRDNVPELTPIKGVWVTNVASECLYSAENIQSTVKLCRESGITDIYVVVWNRSRTLYPSAVMDSLFGVPIMERYAGRDPLQEMIEAGHAVGIKVHAWFEFGFAASYNEPDGGMILRKYPHWKSLDYAGHLTTKNGFEWMNALHPEVQAFVTSLVMEVVQRYEVDGIQGDDRLPAMPSLGGYDPYTVSLYQQEHNGAMPPTDYQDAEWLTWRADKLTTYLGTLHTAVKQAKPHVIVSMAPSIHPWAKEEYLQDWPTWLSKGYCDYVVPQVYRYTIEQYTTTLQSQLQYIDSAQRHRFFSGVLLQVGAFNPTQGFLDSMIVANRANGVGGESFFFFEGLKKYPEYFRDIYPSK